MHQYLWIVYALCAAGCAALVSIFGKVGMKGIDSNLATTVRGVVQATLLVLFATVLGLWSGLPAIKGRAVWMIILSGAAGAASWLFMFKAISLADVSRVSPLDKLSVPFAVLLAFFFLGERPAAVNWIGVGLIAVGAYLTAIKA
jgi:transporter family protein